MPRLALLIDEFQVLFEGPRPLADEAENLLSRLVRLGRNTGIHVVLASQTIRDAARLRPILDQLSTRILLKSSEADARAILSDAALEQELPVEQGDALFNDANGLPGATRRVRVSFADPKARAQIIQKICERDAESRVKPRVFDGARRPTAPEVPAEDVFPRVALGEPFTLNHQLTELVPPEPGRNYLVVGARPELRTDVLVQFANAFTAQSNGQVWIVEVPRYGAGGSREGLAGRLAGNAGIKLVSRQNLLLDLGALRAETEARRESRNGDAPTLIVIEDLHRNRELAPQDPYSRDPKRNSSDELEFIMRYGPEVGIHAVISVDAWRRVSECLTRTAARELGVVIIQQVGRDESVSAISSDAAVYLGDDSVVICHTSSGDCAAFRPFRPAVAVADE